MVFGYVFNLNLERVVKAELRNTTVSYYLSSHIRVNFPGLGTNKLNNLCFGLVWTLKEKPVLNY